MDSGFVEEQIILHSVIWTSGRFKKANPATLALASYFIPGLNVAMWICIGTAAICAILGSLMEDNNIDLFLKYSLWETHFHQAPDELPSWWINVNTENQEDGLLREFPKKDKK